MRILPEAVSGTTLYEPGENAAEERARQFLRERWGEIWILIFATTGATFFERE